MCVCLQVCGRAAWLQHDLEGVGGKEALLYLKFRKELEKGLDCQRCVLGLHFATKTALFREAKDTYFSIFLLTCSLVLHWAISFPYIFQSILKIFKEM